MEQGGVGLQCNNQFSCLLYLFVCFHVVHIIQWSRTPSTRFDNNKSNPFRPFFSYCCSVCLTLKELPHSKVGHKQEEPAEKKGWKSEMAYDARGLCAMDVSGSHIRDARLYLVNLSLIRLIDICR